MLAGAFDASGGGAVLAVAGYEQPAHGSVTMAADGYFDYTLAKDYNGPDSWVFNATDGFNGVASGTVFVAVGECMQAHYPDTRYQFPRLPRVHKVYSMS